MWWLGLKLKPRRWPHDGPPLCHRVQKVTPPLAAAQRGFIVSRQIPTTADRIAPRAALIKSKKAIDLSNFLNPPPATDQANVIPLAPRRLLNRPVDIYPAEKEVGGFEVIIWQNDCRDDGLMVHIPDLASVYRFLRESELVM